jgi:hypothetical protein
MPKRFPRLEVELRTLRVGQKFCMCLEYGKDVNGEVLYITQGSVYVETEKGKTEHWSLGSLVYAFPISGKFTEREKENMSMQREVQKRREEKKILRFPRPYRFPRLK